MKVSPLKASMMEKRYQVFVSSTYADLQTERRAVIETLVEADCIPAGMELFPAADEDQFAFIKRVIDDCDYYLLIIGGRYGSVTQSGISYTEQEYDYAVRKGLKVIALIHGKPEDIPFGKSEQDPVLRERLQRFKDKVSTGRLVKFWEKPEELPGLVALSLSKTIRLYPAVGWVRANAVASQDLLQEMNELRKESARLQKALSEIESTPVVTGLAGLDEKITLQGSYIDPYTVGSRRTPWEMKVSWRDIFGAISPYIVKFPTEHDVKKKLSEAMMTKANLRGSLPEINDQLFETVAIQLKALGLVNITYMRVANPLFAPPGVWSLTASGEKLMTEIRAVRSGTTTPVT